MKLVGKILLYLATIPVAIFVAALFIMSTRSSVPDDTKTLADARAKAAQISAVASQAIAKDAKSEAVEKEQEEPRFKAGVFDRLKPSAGQWEDLQLVHDQDGAYSAVIYYGRSPGSLFEIIDDEKKVALAILQQLLADGHHPAQDKMSPTVFAVLRTTGVTGQGSVVCYGSTSYDYRRDQLKFENTKPALPGC